MAAFSIKVQKGISRHIIDVDVAGLKRVATPEMEPKSTGVTKATGGAALYTSTMDS